MDTQLKKSALITGITGQDGSYLAELLLSKGYEVWGMLRRSSTTNLQRIGHLRQRDCPVNERLHLSHGDMTDVGSLQSVIEESQPDEIYALASQSHVKISFDVPEYTADVTGLGTLRILQAMRDVGCDARLFHAGSSEQFGKVSETPQNEQTPFYPRSPYACAKVFAFNIVRNYRESYGMFAANGIFFNHESPRRGETFVTRKITRAAAAFQRGRTDVLLLGNLDARRDWGFAGDYVEAMWKILQAPSADDFVIATGETHTVREFCERAFAQAQLPITWEGTGMEEKGIGPQGQILISIDERFFRPAEVDLLLGDASKARETLGWNPTVKFNQLVDMMVRADLDAIS
ncbi:MAG: GDP-mannose 4,6-dehydratase [Planctomycetaceae bacterium]|nr:GDP-mannose 4,6-dehydratase [Planctomycetaceae bacterium]